MAAPFWASMTHTRSGTVASTAVFPSGDVCSQYKFSFLNGTYCKKRMEMICPSAAFHL